MLHANLKSHVLARLKFRAIRKWFFLAMILALLPIGAGRAFAQDQDFRLQGTFGFGYSNGSYGTDRNTDVALNLWTLSAITGNLKFDVSVPYLRISGRGLVVFDAAGNPVIINRSKSVIPTVRTGFSDMNFSATYTIPPAVLDNFEVKLTARAKVPTASARKRLSTGAADFGGNVDVSRQFGIWGPFVSVGYLIPGQPATFSLNNRVSISAGTSMELNDHLVAIVSYDHDSASSRLVGTSQEAFGSLSWIFSDRVTLTGYGTAGLSSGSPEVGGGLIISYELP
jgi:hypothetical protein